MSYKLDGLLHDGQVWVSIPDLLLYLASVGERGGLSAGQVALIEAMIWDIRAMVGKDG